MIDLRARPSVDFKEDSLVYEKSCVDAALAEKDNDIEGWKAGYSNLLNVDIPRIEGNLKKRIADLESALESEKARRCADAVDAGVRERKLKRALYKACANWMIARQCAMTCFHHLEARAKKFNKAIAKCLAMAEKYK